MFVCTVFVQLMYLDDYGDKCHEQMIYLKDNIN